jgi:hypothetical protein
VLPHSEIIVRAPIYDVLDIVGAVPNSVGKISTFSDYIIEYPILSGIFEIGYKIFEWVKIYHKLIYTVNT